MLHIFKIKKNSIIVSFKITPIIRSISILRNAKNSGQGLGLYLSLPIKVKITKRFGSTDKITQCAGDACKKFFNAVVPGRSSAQALLKAKESLPNTGKVPDLPKATSSLLQETPKPFQGASKINSLDSFREKVANVKQATNTFSSSPQSTTNSFFSNRLGKGTALNQENTPPILYTHVRGYATVTNNAWDSQTTDPQAPINNPGNPIHHPEIRLNTCNLPGCTGVICTGLCGNLKGSKAVGHLTHGYPTIPPSQGQVVNLDANTDAKGSPDPQNAVMYAKGHTAGQTVENVQGSAFFNQAHVLDQIEKHADKS